MRKSTTAAVKAAEALGMTHVKEAEYFQRDTSYDAATEVLMTVDAMVTHATIAHSRDHEGLHNVYVAFAKNAEDEQFVLGVSFQFPGTDVFHAFTHVGG
jgi:hypothetical protein